MTFSKWTAVAALLCIIAGCGDDSTCADGACGGAGASSSDGPSTTQGTGQGTSTHSTGVTGSTTGNASGTTGSAGTASTGSGMDEATVNLTFSGTCSPSFTGDLVVAANSESVAISTITAPISNIQFDLHQTSGSIALSTPERVRTGDVVNLVSQNTTWTNASTQQPDTISGTLTVNHYEEQAGVLDLAFSNVVLENVQDHSLCTINGTLTTTGTSF